MRRTAPEHLALHRFPVEPWRLVEQEYDRSDLGLTETLFAVANGYIGLRANPEEGRDAHSHGTYLNGFHETWSITHAEDAFGFAKVGQTIVNAPDAKVLKLYVDDEPLLLSTADLESYERVLDLRDGTLTRDLVWRTPGGKRVRVRSQRLVSLVHRHLAVMTFEVTMLDGSAPIVISSQLGRRGRVPRDDGGAGPDGRPAPQPPVRPSRPDPQAAPRRRG
jgi:alpha,alpha-trehalose phosphorylase